MAHKLKFYFLGSGSRGNCTLVETNQGKFLIDMGFGLKRTNQLLGEVGVSIDEISAVLLTHTHNDHINGPMLRRISKAGTNLFCREEHQYNLQPHYGYQMLKIKKQVSFYGNDAFEPIPGLTVEPIALSHDSPATHGFMFHIPHQNGSAFHFAYVADCGHSCVPTVTEKIKDADMIALEFNHDEEMERNSGRHPALIYRVLGPSGHLSNDRAAELLASLKSSRLKKVVQLHLSQDCNCPDLAMSAAKNRLGAIPIHQTSQYQIGPIIEIEN